jgi:hypothetical protein
MLRKRRVSQLILKTIGSLLSPQINQIQMKPIEFVAFKLLVKIIAITSISQTTSKIFIYFQIMMHIQHFFILLIAHTASPTLQIYSSADSFFPRYSHSKELQNRKLITITNPPPPPPTT